MTENDWTRGKIRYELEKVGQTNLRQIDIDHGLPVTTISNSISRPDVRGERILSKLLGVPPETIWPSRYDASGERLKPQPMNLIRAEADRRHRQKGEAA